MYIDDIKFWTTILSNVISGLVVGGILGGVGYFIWKRQYLYSKKLDSYTSFMNSLHLFVAVLSNLHTYIKHNEPKEIIDAYIKQNNDDFVTLLTSRNIFTFYFGDKHFQPIQDLINNYLDLKNSIDIKMTTKELDDYILVTLLLFDNIKFK